MKRKFSLGLAMVMAVGVLAGCGSSSTTTTTTETTAETTTEETVESMSGSITVVSREDGSGTRGAFIELLGIEAKDENGNKVDYTTDMAEITNSTAVMTTTIASNKFAIGYVSLGSLNDTVKALAIDGVEATVDNIKNGTYAIARPFNIATAGEIGEVAQDFINFIMSEEGQAVVEASGYISQGNTGAFAAAGVSGKITVAGSSSVTPVMEKLKEAYIAINPDVTIEIQQNDSTTGMNSAVEGVCEIGMASRELKDSELESGLTPLVIGMDGIAVVVNLDNTIDGVTSESVRAIYTAEITDWSEAK